MFVTSLASLIFWLTYSLGGLYSSAAYWIILPPLIATFIGNIKLGYCWSIISLIGATVIYLLQNANCPFPIPPITNPLLLQYLGICGLNLVILSVLYFYEINIKANLIKLRFIAYHDLLTGLPNRMAYQQALEKATQTAQQQHTDFSIYCINIDNFKKINAIFGQDIANHLLHDIPKRIKRHTSYAENMSRVGGDEYKIIIENIKSADEHQEISNVILATLRIPYHIKKHEIHITASIGVATYHPDDENNIHIDRYADLALLKAKSLGGNNFQYFTEALAKESTLQIAIELNLPEAIARNELQINFQPIFHAANTNKITGYEVLMRWHSKLLGNIPPSVFIPVAEKIDIISQLDQWALKEACKTYKAWQQANLLDDEIYFSVNVSPQQLYDDLFVQSIHKTLEETGVATKNVVIELTESSIITDPLRAMMILKNLNDLGIKSVIDDFGAGQTSLSYLAMLPVSAVKIDKSFIDIMLMSKGNHDIIVKFIIELAHKLNLKVVSEGVETAAQLNYLTEIQCDYIQGFYLSKPLDKSGMSTFLAELKKKNNT